MIPRLILTFVVLTVPVGLAAHYLGVTWALGVTWIIWSISLVAFVTWILLQAIWENFY
jgi:hypothetical protein